MSRDICTRGSKLLSGRVQNDNYTNKDGQMVYSVRIMVDEIEFAESKNASAGNGYGGNAGGYNNNGGGFNNGGFQSGGNTPAASGAADGFMNIPDGIDEELPFN